MAAPWPDIFQEPIRVSGDGAQDIPNRYSIVQHPADTRQDGWQVSR